LGYAALTFIRHSRYASQSPKIEVDIPLPTLPKNSLICCMSDALEAYEMATIIARSQFLKSSRGEAALAVMECFILLRFFGVKFQCKLVIFAFSFIQ
jgi:hypothetical protein